VSTTNSGHAENFVANPLDAHAAENDDHQDGVDRRGFLKCMAWAGTGLVWTLGTRPAPHSRTPTPPFCHALVCIPASTQGNSAARRGKAASAAAAPA